MMIPNLMSYEQVIRNYAIKQGCTPAVALTHFMVNLAVMRDHYKGFPASINFREIGQQWNDLPSDQRIQQRNDLQTKLITVAPRNRGM